MTKTVALAFAFASVMSGLIYAQARSAPDWTTQGFDAQRTSWMRVDPYISIDNMSKFQFIWKLKVDNESRHGNALTADRKSTRLNSSHSQISYAVFCLKKKTKQRM